MLTSSYQLAHRFLTKFVTYIIIVNCKEKGKNRIDRFLYFSLNNVWDPKVL